MEKIDTFKSVVLTSSAPDCTAAFYRNVIGLPIAEEQHRGVARHWAGQVGSLHFAIHARHGFWLPSDVADTIVSFTGDVDACAETFAEHGVEVVARNRIGPMSFIAVRDPDGRYVGIGTPWPQRGVRSNAR